MHRCIDGFTDFREVNNIVVFRINLFLSQAKHCAIDVDVLTACQDWIKARA